MQEFGQPGHATGGARGGEGLPAPAWAPPTMYSSDDEEQLTVMQEPPARPAAQPREGEEEAADAEGTEKKRDEEDGSISARDTEATVAEDGEDNATDAGEATAGRHAREQDSDAEGEERKPEADDEDTGEVAQLAPDSGEVGTHGGVEQGTENTPGGEEPVTPARPMNGGEQLTTMLSPSYAEEYARYAQAYGPTAYEQQQAYAQQYGAQSGHPQGYAQPQPGHEQYPPQGYSSGYPQGYVVPSYPTTGAPAGYGTPQAQPGYEQPGQVYPQTAPGYQQPGYPYTEQQYDPAQAQAQQPYGQPDAQVAAGQQATPAGYPPAPPYPGHAAYPPATYSLSGGEPLRSADPQSPAGAQPGQVAPAQSLPPAPAAKPSVDIDAGRFVPTAEEFAARRAHRPTAPEPTMGLPALIKKLTFGMVAPPMSRREEEFREQVSTVRRNFGGLRQVTVVNPKGGAGKTVAVLMTAMTFGQNRGGYVLAWDNNETQGTLGMRAQPDFHSRTVRDVLDNLDNFLGKSGKVGDLTSYVRSQGGAMFDVLASDESATAGEMLTASAFKDIREVVSRFYKLIIVDTGNNVRAENWQAAIDATDQLVVTMSARGDSAETAARMLDHLEQTGRAELVRKAVTVVSMPASRKGLDLPAIERHFSARTRGVLHAPYEPLLDSGEPIRYEAISQGTREAWLKIAAAVAEGL